MAGVRRLAFLLVAWLPMAAQQPLTPFQDQKARALLRSNLPCLGCHELDGDGGRSAPSLTTVGERRSAAYIRAIVENPQAVLPGVAMPTHVMATATRELIVRFLSRNAHGSDTRVPASQPRVPAAGPLDGSALYARWCASCHGSGGAGDGPNAKHLPVPPAVHTNATLMGARSDDMLHDAIAGGGTVLGKSARMPAFAGTLSRAEVRALVHQLRAFCRCEGPAWSRGVAAP